MKKTTVKTATSLKNIKALNTQQLAQIKGGTRGIIIEDEVMGGRVSIVIEDQVMG
jgi:hypothetical protein